MTSLHLSHPQRRIWFAENETPGSAVNNLGFYVTCDPADAAVLENAILKYIELNDALRLQIKNDPRSEIGVTQYFAQFSRFEVPRKTFTGMKEAEKWMRRESRLPFTLYDAPLFSFCIISTRDRELGYFLKIHHLISDGATSLSLAAGIAELCGSESYEPPAGSYKEFIEAEEKYLGSGDCTEDRDFWMDELSSFPEKLTWPSAGPSDSFPAGSPAVRSFSPGLRARIHEFAKANGLSPYKLILSALGIYLAKVCRTDSFGIGIANHNRGEKRFRNTAGMFVSTLPFLFKIDHDRTFHAHAGEVGTRINTILKQHARYPFDLLAGDMGKTHGEDISHLLNVNIIGHPDLEGFPDMENMCAGAPVSDLALHINADNRDREGILELMFVVNNTLGERDVETLFQGLTAILERALEHPDTPIGKLPLISREEQARILGLNPPFTPYRDTVSLPEIFRERVIETPDAVALSCNGNSLTYRELDTWSDTIARALQADHLETTGREIAPGEFIGISMARGMEMIAAIWGILKAGGAFAPLDPTYPEERLRFIVEDAGIRLVLLHEEFAPLFKQVATIAVDHIPARAPSGETASEGFGLRAKSHDFAYVIYTSGTTGKPKGVPIRHHQVVNLCDGLRGPFLIDDQSRVLQFASLNFDASVAEIFPAFVAGAALFVALEEQRVDGDALCRLLETEKITTTHVPPALLAVMPKKELPHLKCLIVAGEATDPSAIDYWSRNRAMINGYGPTENTVAVSVGRFEADSSSNDIGPPLQNVSCYVLDEQFQPVPMGIPGELFVGGVQVSEGYINRPELTGEKFIPNPHAGTEGTREWNSRLYRTGDLVRRLDNGHLEFIGRVDFQVKIRGHRIECGEVSSRMGELSGVAACLVVPHKSGATHRLVAYLIMEESADRGMDTIREAAAEILPDYMVPSAFVELDAFPMTANGKINRRKLPEPTYGDAFKTDYVAPGTETEERLCRIWAGILDLEKIGIRDDFFNLGGNSLLCMSMIARANEEGIFLNVPMVRNHPTVEALAGRLRENRDEGHGAIPGMVKVDAASPVPIPFNVAIMHRQTQSMERAGSILSPSVSTWRLSGELNPELLVQSIDDLVRSHQALRTRITEDGESVMFSLLENASPCPLISISEKDLDARIKEWQASHMSGGEPLCAFRLFQLSEGDHLLAIIADHLVMDAWAMNLLCEELSERYNAAREKREPNIQAPAFQLFDFSVWYNELVGSEALNSSREFWQTTLKNAVPLFTEPLNPDPELGHHAAVQAFLPLPPEVRESFHDLCTRRKCTPFEGYFTVYNQLLSNLTDSTDILSACVMALRDRPELQNLMGCLTNRLYIRASVHGDSDFPDALKAVGTGLNNAMAHSLYPVSREMDPGGKGFPDAFFHYIPKAGGAAPGFNGVDVKAAPLAPPAYWPLPMVVQVLDDPDHPGLICLGNAGFLDRACGEKLLGEYMDLLTRTISA